MQVIDGIKYVTTDGAARITGLHRNTLANQRCAGRSPITFRAIGRTVLYPLAEVERYAATLGR